MGTLGIGHSGVVDQDIDRAKRVFRRSNGGDHRIRVGRVHLHGNGPAAGGADLVSQRLKPVLAAGGEHHGGPLAGQHFGKARAQA